MKTIYIKDLKVGEVFENEPFALFGVTKAEDKNGKPYYNLVLGDKTGKLGAKVWNDAIPNVDKNSLKEGNVILVTGKIDEFKGVSQISVLRTSQVDETSLDEFIESSMFDPAEMYQELEDHVGNISNASLKKVLKKIVEDKEIKSRLMFWPAATAVHHEFRSGLLQHILEMLTVAEGLERFYPDVDFDILSSGIILHDLGKLYELDGKNLAVPYTRTGSLHGHIYIGARMFEQFAGQELDEVTHDHVLHLILSHHGILEYGSPVVPATTEAILLTYIDNVSAKARTADKAVRSIGSDDEFSDRVYWLENAKMWNARKGNDSSQMKLV